MADGMAVPLPELFPGGLQSKDTFGFNLVRNSPGSSFKNARWQDCGSNNHNAHLWGYIIIQ